MFPFGYFGEVPVQFDSSKDRENGVDYQWNHTYYIREDSSWVAFDVIYFGYGEEEDAQVGQEENITGVVPSESK